MRRMQLICVLSSATCLVTTGQSTASISGNLVPELIYTPIPNAQVTAMRQGLPPFSETVTAGADGTYQISGLPAGSYLICVQAKGFINPCEWNTPTLFVSLAAGQASSRNTVLVRLGSTAQMRILDPRGFLNQKTADGRTPGLLAGVWQGDGNGSSRGSTVPGVSLAKPPLIPTPLLFHSLHPAGTDSGGVNYELTIPRNVALKFHISSSDLLLGDAQGLPLVSNLAEQALSPAVGNATPSAFVYTVIGRPAGK